MIMLLHSSSSTSPTPETISTLENGRALALALAGHLEPAVTECLKEFPGTNSEYQPQISTEVSTTVKNGIM